MKSEKSTVRPTFPLIAHCHLGWDWVWQRPQQFLSRLAQHHPVLFVETRPPHPDLSEPRISARRTHVANLTLAILEFPAARWLDGAYVDAGRRRLLKELLAGPLEGMFDYPVQWFYDPMAVTAFAGHLDEIAIVYDCMDELSQFRGAPPEIIARERQLLELADVVFVGGRRLWEAKRRHNPNCHFYGCGVDVPHFGQALLPDTVLPDDLRQIPAPRLGYFGVVDERIDYALVSRLATENPDLSIVMIGPTTKVDPADLPRHPNLHWLGGRPYAALPHYAKGFTVCLMPFALNEATEYINPTKALEYMATGRPIVSTAVPDVVSNFPSVVHIADSAVGFVSACRRCVTTPDPRRVEKGLKLARANTWEHIVGRLRRHVNDALRQKRDRLFYYQTHLRLAPRGGRIRLPLPALSRPG
jgi:glycosyltransferase involved in cell wall biosynthesis